MTKLIKKVAPAIIMLGVFALVLAPMVSFAAMNNTPPDVGTLPEDTGLPEVSLPEFVGQIIQWILGIIGVILIALFVYGGFTYATSAGSQDKIENGKKIMMYAIIGVVIIVVAFVLTEYIINALLSNA